MTSLLFVYFVFGAVWCSSSSHFATAFCPSLPTTRTTRTRTRGSAAVVVGRGGGVSLAATASVSDLSKPEQKVYGLLEDLHASSYPFRIVVVGNGAILETTATLGPTMKLGQSPKTNAHLVTFANDDQSFEFHLQIALVKQMALIEKESPVNPGKTMRVIRFLNGEGTNICSLIVGADAAEDVSAWYRSLQDKYGSDITL